MFSPMTAARARDQTAPPLPRCRCARSRRTRRPATCPRIGLGWPPLHRPAAQRGGRQGQQARKLRRPARLQRVGLGPPN
eukprot:8065618-Alexandrium_andersonii.AAC.1